MARRRPPADAPAMPYDIRLMNGVASVLYALVALGLLAALGLWLVRSPWLNIRAVELEGELQRNNVATIRANAMPRLHGNFISMNLEQARAVFEANVGDVEEERLPHFSGPDGSSAQMLALYLRLQPLFAAHQLQPESLQLSGRGSWSLELDSGATVVLGRGSEDELVARSDRFLRTLGQVTGRFQRDLEHADLRHADGYAVRLRGITTTIAPAAAAAKKPR